MKRIKAAYFLYAILFVGMTCKTLSAAGQIDENKQSSFKNPIVFGNNRITLITPTLFRLEYAEDGKFLDSTTMFAYTRENLLSDFKVVKLDGKRYQIETSCLRMVYENDGFPFENIIMRLLSKGTEEKKFTIRNIHKNNLEVRFNTRQVDKRVPPMTAFSHRTAGT